MSHRGAAAHAERVVRRYPGAQALRGGWPAVLRPGSRALFKASLSVAKVRNNDDGNVRLVKRGTNNEARDDVAAALTLAAGARSRMPKRSLGVYLGVA